MFMVEDNQYNFSISDLNDTKFKDRKIPIVLDWSAGNQTCEQAKKSPQAGMPYACHSSNSLCNKSNNGIGYLCQCATGYQGNPYLDGDAKVQICQVFPKKSF